jgi:ribosome-associated protein
MAPTDDLLVQDGLVIPAAELEVAVSRSSGPGGQHVNTTDSRVQLRWNVLESAVLTEAQRERLARKLAARISGEGVLTVACDTHRSQHRNREEARGRLAELVREGLRQPKPRRRTRLPRAAKERRLEQKRKRAEIKRRRRNPRED